MLPVIPPMTGELVVTAAKTVYSSPSFLKMSKLKHKSASKSLDMGQPPPLEKYPKIIRKKKVHQQVWKTPPPLDNVRKNTVFILGWLP